MICKRCGNIVSNGIRFCDRCGAAVGGVILVTSPKQNIRNSVMKNVLVKVVITIIATLVVFVVGVNVFNRNSADSIVEKYLEATEIMDASRMIKLKAPEVQNALMENKCVNSIDELAELVQEEVNKAKGDTVKIKCEIMSQEEYEGESLNRIKEEIYSELGINDLDITKAVIYNVSLDYISKFGYINKTRTEKLYVCKENGRWYVFID